MTTFDIVVPLAALGLALGAVLIAKIIDRREQCRSDAAAREAREITPDAIHLPKWMLDHLDSRAERLGVTRQDLVRMWIGERLQ